MAGVPTNDPSILRCGQTSFPPCLVSCADWPHPSSLPPVQIGRSSCPDPPIRNFSAQQGPLDATRQSDVRRLLAASARPRWCAPLPSRSSGVELQRFPTVNTPVKHLSLTVRHSAASTCCIHDEQSAPPRESRRGGGRQKRDSSNSSYHSSSSSSTLPCQ